jgi:hypothetical protein
MSSFRDGRMEMDELTATCEDGITYLDGWLHSETKYQTLKRYGDIPACRLPPSLSKSGLIPHSTVRFEERQ